MIRVSFFALAEKVFSVIHSDKQKLTDLFLII